MIIKIQNLGALFVIYVTPKIKSFGHSLVSREIGVTKTLNVGPMTREPTSQLTSHLGGLYLNEY
jgi:hypothetical protein